MRGPICQYHAANTPKYYKHCFSWRHRRARSHNGFFFDTCLNWIWTRVQINLVFIPFTMSRNPIRCCVSSISRRARDPSPRFGRNFCSNICGTHLKWRHLTWSGFMNRCHMIVFGILRSLLNERTEVKGILSNFCGVSTSIWWIDGLPGRVSSVRIICPILSLWIQYFTEANMQASSTNAQISWWWLSSNFIRSNRRDLMMHHSICERFNENASQQRASSSSTVDVS
jgi:hypothetical protein